MEAPTGDACWGVIGSQLLGLHLGLPFALAPLTHHRFALLMLQVCGGYTDQMAQVSQLLYDTLGDNIDFVDINCGEGEGGRSMQGCV